MRWPYSAVHINNSCPCKEIFCSFLRSADNGGNTPVHKNASALTGRISFRKVLYLVFQEDQTIYAFFGPGRHNRSDYSRYNLF